MHRMTVQYAAPADPEAFEEHYLGTHVPLSRALPGLLSISVSRPRPLGPGTSPFLVAELDFDDADALKLALRSAEMAAVAADAETIAADRVMFTGEVVRQD